MFHQGFDVLQGIADGLTRPEKRRTRIDSICPMVDGDYAAG